MKKFKKIIFLLVVLFFAGCNNSQGSDEQTQVISSQTQNELYNEPVFILDSTYKVMYNDTQKKSSTDITAINESKQTLIKNFELTKKNIVNDQLVNIIPLANSVSKNQNGKFINYNLLVVNTSGKILTDFKTTIEYSIEGTNYIDVHGLEMKEIGMTQLKDDEAILMSYSADITDQPDEYFDDVKIENIRTKLLDLVVTTK
ncbi:hypothetical protein [Carnobacterium maltaromaticum]|uniref:hypothetical protein n=1 Tax=Carnobacterium maltaromaticum TaxID=2751 RepID=UPI0010720CBE|nr:hypothetical protein [Carnobacterium maltaromaticum]